MENDPLLHTGAKWVKSPGKEIATLGLKVKSLNGNCRGGTNEYIRLTL